MIRVSIMELRNVSRVLVFISSPLLFPILLLDRNSVKPHTNLIWLLLIKLLQFGLFWHRYFYCLFYTSWFPQLGAVWTVPVLWDTLYSCRTNGSFWWACSPGEEWGWWFWQTLWSLCRYTGSYNLIFFVLLLMGYSLQSCLWLFFTGNLVFFFTYIDDETGNRHGGSFRWKIKAVTYVTAGVLALIAVSIQRLLANSSLFNTIKNGRSHCVCNICGHFIRLFYWLLPGV